MGLRKSIFSACLVVALAVGLLPLPAVAAQDGSASAFVASSLSEEAPSDGEGEKSEPIDVAGVSIGAIGKQTYTGFPIKPSLTVTHEGNALKKGVDYSLSWSSNTNAGTATVTVTGNGKYTGKKTSEFEIVACPMSKVTASSIATQAYTGKEIKPSVTLKNGDNKLRNADYTLSYKNNTKVGEATVTATAKSKNYTGSKAIKFKIAKTSIKGATMAAIANQTYAGKAITPAPAIKLGGKTLKKDADYSLSYKSNTKVGTAKVTAAGKGIYSGSVSKAFTIVKAPMSKVKVAAILAKTYSGSAFKPAPKVTFNGKALKKGADYTLSWKNNVKAGTATVVVTGKGNFTGAKNAAFKINRTSVAKASVGPVADARYTGRAITPSPAVKLGGRTLEKGADYTLSYRNNVNAGTAQVVVTGKGNYQGTRTVSFKIVKPAAPKPNVSSTVYITKSGKKYHRDGCSSLRKSKIAISRSDAIKKGYEACKNCKP